MRTTRFLASILAAGCLLAPAARADLINGGFETADFTGWSVAGDALVVTSAIGVTPPEGTFQAFLTTASENGDANNFSGSDAVPAADLEAFLELPAGTIASGFEGSAIRQEFAADAGDVLTFRYKFLTTEGTRNDFAFVSLADFGALADTQAADLVASAVVLDPIFGEPTRETGWRTFSHTFATAGTFTLGIGVADVGDEFTPSALLVDDARVLSGAIIPEPPTFALLGTGIVVAALVPWRRGWTTPAERPHR
jgi:hypothetical protein